MMNKAMKTKLFVLCCLLVVLIGLISSGPAYGHSYTVPSNGKFLVVVSYPLWQAGGGASGNLHQQLQNYIQDLQNASWTVEALFVSTSDFVLPTFQNCTTYKLFYQTADADRLELKNAIMNRLPNNCSDTVSNGLVLIGSEPDIPTVWWRGSLKLDSYGNMEGCHPTDLYYADRADWEIWKFTNQSLAPDQTGVGDVYTFKDENGQLVNPYYEPIPKLIFGRISGRAICTATTDPDRLTEEAGKITGYLAKIHNYRLNGSNLTLEQQQSAIFYHEDAYTDTNSGGVYNYPSVGEIANRVYEYKDLTVTNHETLAKALGRGSQFFFMMDHTYQDAFCNEEWPDTDYRKIGYNFGLNALNAIIPKVHYYYLFCCSACRFSVPNLGETLLLNNDYAYNIIGKTAPDNVAMGTDVVRELNDGETAGRAFYNDAYWIHDNFHDNGSCLASSSHILLGDPALTYPRHITNRPPVITNALVSTEFKVNTPESITFGSEDPDYGDSVTYTLEQVNQTSLPAGASFAGATFSWTPSVSQAGKNYYFRVTASDDEGNLHQQEFTIYVNHFGQALFEDYYKIQSSWNIPASWAFSPISIDPSFDFFRDLNKRTNYVIHLTNDYGSIWQHIAVQPRTNYILAFYIRNKTNDTELNVRIPQLNYEYPVNKGLIEPEYASITIYTADQTELDLCIDIGDSSNLATGNLGLSNIKLFDSKQSEMVYLSDLAHMSLTGSYGQDVSHFGSTLSLDGQTFKKGIGTLANSAVTYRLARQYQRFTAYIGIDDLVSENELSGVVFQVLADGQSIYQSNPLYPYSPIQFINLDISGVNILELRVTDNGDGNILDCADWANAKLIMALPAGLSDLEHGLNAEYFEDKELLRLAGKKTDSNIDFVWGSTSPGFGLSADNYSIRWTGKVKADFTGTYTFTTAADDGIRLWVNGQQIINYWNANGWNLQSGSIALEAGKYYDIKVEYFENTGNALAQIMWECNGLPLEIIPTANLFAR